VWLGATPRGLFWVNLGPVDLNALSGFFSGRAVVGFQLGGPVVEQAARELVWYLEGRQEALSVKLDLTGWSSFAKKVWRTTRKIPYGEVRPYGWVAERMGDLHSARAVGQALGRNPVPVFIPCHRVVGSHGSLGGFSAGLSMKRRLLSLEAGQSTLGLGEATREDR
jgi:methylated-DNA-[protein]-cysteine S-methyltransferase